MTHDDSRPDAAPAPGVERCTLRAEYAALAALADWCAGISTRFRLSGAASSALDLCLSELVTNVIEHAYGADGESPIVVDAGDVDGALEISVWDAGSPFNPLERDASPGAMDLATVRIGGLGIDLVRKFTTQLSYARVEDWNRLRFTPAGQ